MTRGAVVCILDYGSGNVRSVFNLFGSECHSVTVSNDERSIAEATHIVLPGVGAFGAAMRKIEARLPMGALRAAVLVERKPFLGICVGMQVLGERGAEFGDHPGLGWISGSVDRLRSGALPLPHVGWNNIKAAAPCPLLEGLAKEPDFYFLHSFVLQPTDPSVVAATADYGATFCCVAQRDNLYGVQFHPEKSQRAGRRLVRNFLGLS